MNSQTVLVKKARRPRLPQTDKSLERWCREWRAIQTPETLKKFWEYLPENNVEFSRPTAIRRLWQKVNADRPFRKLKFKGFEKIPLETIDPAKVEEKLEQRAWDSNLPTTYIRRITLNKEDEN